MCGIGGQTVAEAQERMAYEEFLRWLEFRRKRGTLHVGMRLEEGFALLAAQNANLHSQNKKFTILDFMPHGEERPIRLEDAMQAWE